MSRVLIRVAVWLAERVYLFAPFLIMAVCNIHDEPVLRDFSYDEEALEYVAVTVRGTSDHNNNTLQ